VLTVWQWLVAFRFPLHDGASEPAYAPPVSLLKPLKGVDSETAECLRSWLAQQYAGESEILFGVASGSDPVCEVVAQAMASCPKANVRLVICPENLSANAKVSTLIQLMRIARHQIIIISDADVWAP